MVSTKICGEIHLIGSLEWPFNPQNRITHYVPIIKIKQDLIKRKGLIWYLTHPAIPTTYILNDGNECGLFIIESDSSVAFEIKKSLDNLSEADDTFYVAYMQAFVGPNPIERRIYDYDRFTVDPAYRDSFFDKISLLGRRFANISNRGNKYWFLSDSSLYYSAECFRLYESGNTFEVISFYSLKKKYIEECQTKGYTPMFTQTEYTLPDSLRREDAINNPEIQLLYKYMKMSDSIILNSSFNGRQYDLDIYYDHKKTENQSPFFFKYQRWDTLKNKLKKPRRLKI